MSSCPHCNAELVASSPSVCCSCGTQIGRCADKKPFQAPDGLLGRSEVKQSQAKLEGMLASILGTQAPDPDPPFYYSFLGGVGQFTLWLGHFFLLGLPVLYVAYHLLFYSGGGTSGVPLAFSIMFAPVFYIATAFFWVIASLTPYGRRGR